jgi:hypothetical protein
MIVGAIIVATLGSALPDVVHAAPVASTELSPDRRPVLMLEPPQGDLLLVNHPGRLPDKGSESFALKPGHWIAPPISKRDRREWSAQLPLPWRTSEPDRGFGQALLLQLSGPANWPWQTLIVSSSGPESDSQLQSLVGQDAVIAVVRDELVDLAGKVELHVTLDLTTVRAIATTHETRSRVNVDYFARALSADSGQPRRSVAQFVVAGPLDTQVNTAAADLSEFLATVVARISVPNSLHPHNPTLGELGVRPSCAACRTADPVVYQQPGRVWVQVSKVPGSILALPLQSIRPASRVAHKDHR